MIRPHSLGLVFGQTDFYVERDIQITPGSKVFKAMNPCDCSMYLDAGWILL